MRTSFAILLHIHKKNYRYIAIVFNNYYALSTKPDLKQAVHTYILRVEVAPVLTRTDLTFDFQILFDLL